VCAKSIPLVYKKGWGSEQWIINTNLYCGKLLTFQEGKRCSFHYHKLKTETFFLDSGLIEIKFSYGDVLEQAESTLLFPGESFHVPLGLRHQMCAVEDSRLYEFSTEHFEEDSYRIVKGD